MPLSLASVVCVTSTRLTITAGLQSGFFKTGSDVGAFNPHDYRPNEFVSNDFIYEGLTAWDGDDTDGLDGIAGTDDDWVKPSLAIRWSTNFAAVQASPATPYEITFTLRSGVTFHDGTPWNAAAAKANFDQIMGSDGLSTSRKMLVGMHDWLGFTQSLDSWAVMDDMTFKLTFTTYYEAALRELSFIRPFRMISVTALPSMADGGVSHSRWRFGGPWLPGSPNPNGWPVWNPYLGRGVAAPLGTGPYYVVDKLIKNVETNATRRLPAADFNATCYEGDTCTYGANEVVAEILFKKYAGHWKSPTYDDIVMRAYDSLSDVKAALLNQTLDVAYGVQTVAPSAFLALATDEEGSGVVAHKAPFDMNTRLIVLNSGGALNTTDLRKLVMGLLAPGRRELRMGELAEEEPMETLFDPKLPHCGVLSTMSDVETLAATKSPDVTISNLTGVKLRFLYIKDIPHHQMIAAKVIADLYTHGIEVEVMPVDKDTYNDRHCDYLGPNEDGVDGFHSWDIAISETWGAPYDATSKLWDMTHGQASGWCSAEADAPAVSNMESMPYSVFVTKVRGLSAIVDPTARQAAYDEVLTVLHDEAVFMPLTAKRQTAITNQRVSGFKFGFMEYDLPLANLYPTPPAFIALSGGAVGGIIVASLAGAMLLLGIILLIFHEKKGTPIFKKSLDQPTKGPEAPEGPEAPDC